jgi:hypothetical protein
MIYYVLKKIVQTEPREQREQCQARLNIAESRPRSMTINAENLFYAEVQPIFAT